MGQTEELISNIIDTDFSNLDEETIERAKWRVLDSIGVTIAGANGTCCNQMINLVKKWGGAEESTILVHGGKVVAHNVAFVNSLMMRSYDFEAIEAEGENKTSSAAHISGTTVPTALAVAEQYAASGKEFITALVLGDDLASRLGSASGFNVYAGWDNTGTINAFGATAIACKLKKLNAKQIRNAFGIVLNQLGGTIDNVFDKVVSFKLPIALAAKNGIFSAELAEQGFGGPKDAFLGSHGYFALYCSNPKTDGLTKDLGKKFYADCVIKPYSSCRATHPSIDAVLKIANNHDFRAEDIEEVVIHVTPRTLKGFVGQPFSIGEYPQIDAAFSIRYTAANALLRKGVRPEHFSEENIRDPKISELIDKIKIVDTLPPDEYQTANADIKLKDGQVFSSRIDVPSGDIYKTPLTNNDIIKKYNDNIAFSKTVSAENADKVLSMVRNLENLEDIRELIKLVVKS